ncbi:MAG: helix-turn-helix domain-containing protein [Xanthomonadaceae bacterium]|nr:helix-turn-helix domain-containing protein [Xanthomonadaceae bacterium]
MNPETPLAPGDLVDEREAAAILGCAVQSLRNWRWKRTGPRVYKVGLRLVRYHRADLAAFIAGDAGSERVA